MVGDGSAMSAGLNPWWRGRLGTGFCLGWRGFAADEGRTTGTVAPVRPGADTLRRATGSADPHIRRSRSVSARRMRAVGAIEAGRQGLLGLIWRA